MSDLAPQSLVAELERYSASLLARAQQAETVRRDLAPAAITAAVWALRGVILSERTNSAYPDQVLWRRHLQTILHGCHL